MGIPMEIDVDNVLHYVAEIAQFHRVQGMKELPQAARFVKEELETYGFFVKLIKGEYDGESWHGTLKSPVAWELFKVSVKTGEAILDGSPLVALQHSPPGSERGKIHPISSEDDWRVAEGKIVLVGENWYENYKRANEEGAHGFVAYRRGSGDGIPYVGLFLTMDELEWADIPAVAVSETFAEKLRPGKEVELQVEAEFKRREKLPIVYASLGKPPYLLLTAHLCHPKPGANDNASGSALLLELARNLAKYENFENIGVAFLWIPEYHGSQFFMENVGGEFYASINLDMVGGSFDRSGSRLLLVRTPLSRFSILSGLLEDELTRENFHGRSIGGVPLPRMPQTSVPYELGSDHDVLNFHGVPAVMSITWPDRFYHTHIDSISNLDGLTLKTVGNAVLNTVRRLSTIDEREFKKLEKKLVFRELGRTFPRSSLSHVLAIGIGRDREKLGLKPMEVKPEGWLRWDFKGLLSFRHLSKRFEGIPKKPLENRKIRTQLHELIMLGEVVGKEESMEVLESEYGKVEEGLEETLNSLLEVGILREL